MKNTIKFTAVALLATALAVTPLAPAEAHGWYHHGGHGGGLLIGAVAGVAGAAVALATLPFQAVGAIVAPEPVVYAPPAPAYYPAPAPAYYSAPAPAYYAPQPVAYYGYPGGYYHYGYRYYR